MSTKNNIQKFALLSLLMLLLGGLMLSSCSKEDDDTDSSTLIKQYGLTGTYRLSVTPTFAYAPITTGTVDGTITDEGNGALRLRFSGFQADPMPFVMSVDAQFTVTETSNGLTVHNVAGKGFFDADPPEGGVDPSTGGGWGLEPGALELGVHSEGKSVISGMYKNSTKQLELELNPSVGMPVIIRIKTAQKLN